MAVQEIVLQNFTAGETTEKLNGRTELAVTHNGFRRMKNFIPQTQGPAEYRNGFVHVHHTRLNKLANLQKFEFSDEQAYLLEFTDGKLRFYRNNGVILEGNIVISGITQANPGVVTTATHGYSDGDEVFLNDVLGMTEVNAKSYIVANKSGTTFELTDVDGNNVDTSAFTAYGSVGRSNKVYEIDSPYLEVDDLFVIDVAQDANTMYISHPKYLPRVLTRTAHTTWTLTVQAQTTDPFTDKQVISGVTQANPGVVTATSHSHSNGDTVTIEEVAGMVELNGNNYVVANKATNTYELTDSDGNNVDTSAFTAYGSVGFSSNVNLIPNAVAIYESRLWYAGPSLTPDKLFASLSPDGNGVPQFDDFTVGTAATDALAFTLNDGEVNKILWLTGTDRLLLAGTNGSIVKVTGSDDETAITPTSIKARPLDRVGVADIPPVNKESFVIYTQRGGLTVKSLQFETLRDNFVPTDLNLTADHIAKNGNLWTRNNATTATNGIKQMIWQTGRPDILWAVKNDGLLIGQTFKPEEGISGWHRHPTGASGEDKHFTMATVPRANAFEQLWVGSERTVNSVVRRYISYQTDTVVYPRLSDYYTGSANQTADEAKWALAMYESMKEYVHLDEASTYDGRDAGIDAAASMTPGATTGTGITFTAGAAVFASTDVGREIRKRAIDGVGDGRAEITAYTNTTTVTCTIQGGADFDSTDAILAGDWYLTTNTLSNLDYLEGRVLGVITDGGTEADVTVASGSVTLAGQASKVHVGLKYEGFIQTNELEFGGETGPSNSKKKNVGKMGIRFQDSAGASVGTDPYKPKTVGFTSTPLSVGNPKLLQSGFKTESFKDKWTREKTVYVRQDNPLPCIVQQLVIYGDAEEV